MHYKKKTLTSLGALLALGSVSVTAMPMLPEYNPYGYLAIDNELLTIDPDTEIYGLPPLEELDYDEDEISDEGYLTIGGGDGYLGIDNELLTVSPDTEVYGLPPLYQLVAEHEAKMARLAQGLDFGFQNMTILETTGDGIYHMAEAFMPFNLGQADLPAPTNLRLDEQGNFSWDTVPGAYGHALRLYYPDGRIASWIQMTPQHFPTSLSANVAFHLSSVHHFSGQLHLVVYARDSENQLGAPSQTFVLNIIRPGLDDISEAELTSNDGWHLHVSNVEGAAFYQPLMFRGTWSTYGRTTRPQLEGPLGWRIPVPDPQLLLLAQAPLPLQMYVQAFTIHLAPSDASMYPLAGQATINMTTRKYVDSVEHMVTLPPVTPPTAPMPERELDDADDAADWLANNRPGLAETAPSAPERPHTSTANAINQGLATSQTPEQMQVNIIANLVNYFNAIFEASMSPATRTVLTPDDITILYFVPPTATTPGRIQFRTSLANPHFYGYLILEPLGVPTPPSAPAQPSQPATQASTAGFVRPTITTPVSISFDLAGGTVVGGSSVANRTITLQSGLSVYQQFGTGIVSQMPNPQREGYRFHGWFVDGRRLTLNTPITESTTVVARWGAIR